MNTTDNEFTNADNLSDAEAQRIHSETGVDPRAKTDQSAPVVNPQSTEENSKKKK